nr:PREDICTED: uncharacterized protein LOC106704361 [Latimeria chalumnae]|eukprot:XP_014346874.1 PREDICTED: uncharacterized protein LOC106704361 [Latimeria chalumnae]
MVWDYKLLLLIFLITVTQTKPPVRDPYKLECQSRNIFCHNMAVCQLDLVTQTFYCQCIPGFTGDGLNHCRKPKASITVLDVRHCDGTGVQTCLVKRAVGENITFKVAIAGNYYPGQITWFKFYSSEGPQFFSYKRRLSTSALLSQEMVILDHNLSLHISHIGEHDFYPNKFWVEVEDSLFKEKKMIEPYDFTEFEMLNPSQLRYYFVLESDPIEFLKSGWEQDFGLIRAIVYDFSQDVPGRVMVAQRLFNLRKDISKQCNGTRNVRSCKCNTGFEGNGVHCIDMDECQEGMPLKCLPQASCVNTYGSYFCQCPEGYEGDGLYSCIDVDECSQRVHRCNNNADCMNSLGSYSCICQGGFFGDGIQCKAKSIWTPWSPWSICGATCGKQNQMRIRLCTNPESGMRCEGPSADLKPCANLQPCPVNGQWSMWSPWSACIDDCTGIKKRVRLCNNPPASYEGLPCKGVKEEIAACDSKTCPVHGMWSPWATWTPCPLSCGLAVISRSRRCDNPTPSHGGQQCIGHGYEEGSCGFPEDYCKYLTRPSESIIPGKLIN